MTERINEHPIVEEIYSYDIIFKYNNVKYTARSHDNIASALLVSNIRSLRKSDREYSSRGIFCNIGHCFDCRVRVNGHNNVRACITVVEQDMEIYSENKFDWD